MSRNEIIIASLFYDLTNEYAVGWTTKELRFDFWWEQICFSSP
jgi:hypothetical protein